MLVIGVYTAPVISKAGDTFGVAFSVDGQEKYTERQNKTTSSSVNMECTDKDIDGSYYYAIEENDHAVKTRIPGLHLNHHTHQLLLRKLKCQFRRDASHHRTHHR